MFARLVFFLAIVSLLVSCSTSLKDYQDTSPQLRLETFFNGKLKAWGTFQDFSDQVVRRFRVEMVGTWDGDQGILDEDFFYADGETQKRIWKLKKISDKRYEGTADDIVGTAIGEVEGFALRWEYTMSLPVDGEIYEVHFTDWMYLVDDNNLINKASVTKFGVEVGQVTLLIQKQ